MGGTTARVLVRPPVAIDLPASRRRNPTRPPHLREEGFTDRFDATTLAFDAFADASRTRVRLTCPPMWNVGPWFDALEVTCAETDRPLVVTRRELDLHDRVHITSPSPISTIRLRDGDGFDHVIEPAADGTGVLAGRNVVMTLSKDNDLCWVQDWIRYHRDVHGADAVLFYDNASTAYGVDQLVEALAEVGGLDAAIVVPWPFRYGPQGDRHGGGWDSHFCQLGMLENARWRHLPRARAVLNGDVDELVVRRTRTTAFQAAVGSRRGVVAYHGIWVPRLADEPSPGAVPRHVDFGAYERPRFRRRHHVLIRRAWFENKWTVVPDRTPPDAQWKIHAISGSLASRWESLRFEFAHFRAINRSWKYDRSTTVPRSRRHHRRARRLVSLMSGVDWNR